MEIKVTQAAKEQIMTITNPDHYMKVDLVKSGCCSMAFTLYEDIKRGDDIMVEVDGLKLLFTPRAKMALAAGTIDYKRRGLFKAFTVTAG